MKAQDIHDDAQRSAYRVMPPQLETLARQHYSSIDKAQRLEGTYLKCLVAAVKELAGADDVLTVLDAVHSEYMPWLEKGVTTSDIADDERKPKQERTRRCLEVQRRLVFARTSKHDVKAYIAAGGAVKELDPATVSRSQLRKFVAGRREVDRIDPAALHTETEKAQRLEAAVVSSFDRMASVIQSIAAIEEETPDAALGIIQALQDRLTELSDAIARDATKDHRVKQYVGKPGEQRGELRLWPH